MRDARDGGEAAGAGSGKHSLYYKLVDAFEWPGCPVCRLALASVYRWLDSFAYENVNDYTIRESLRASKGFCTRHAWQLVDDLHKVMGAAIVYRDIIHTSLPAVARAPQHPGTLLGGQSRNDTLARTLQAPDDCPWCVACARLEAAVVRHLLAGVARPLTVVAHLRRSGGLCRLHFAMAMREGEGTPAAATLASVQLEHWAVLRDDLRKQDYQFRDESRGEEQSSPWRATEQVAGARGIRP